jgi:predicted dehydrogenase
MEDAHRFVEAADDAATRGIVTLAMPHFGPAIYAIRDELGRGTIGRVSGVSARSSHGGPEVYYAEVRDAFEESAGDLWFFDASQASVGALFDMGVYATSQLVAVGGTVARVFGRTATLDKATQLEDTATLLLEFESGALGTMETGWCDPARTNFLNVHGTRGKLQLPGHGGNPLTRWTPGSYTREDIPATAESIDVAPFARGNVHEHFIACIDGRIQPPLSNARYARHVTEVLLAGLSSAKSGVPVTLETRAS